MIFGLAGTLNAGKDSLGNWLEEQHGFLHVSTSDMIRKMKRDAYGDGPESLLTRNDPFINNLRSERGPGFLIDAVYEDWLKVKDQYPGGCIASGVRAIGEEERIHELGGKLIFVDADPSIRYERAMKRARDANEIGRTFEEFMATERSEIDVEQTDKNISNLAAMKRTADIVIENNASSLEEFIAQAKITLKEYL